MDGRRQALRAVLAGCRHLYDRVRSRRALDLKTPAGYLAAREVAQPTLAGTTNPHTRLPCLAGYLTMRACGQGRIAHPKGK